MEEEREIATSRKLLEWLDLIGKDLDRTMSFWMKHSHDVEHGGFFNCLSKDGRCYDETKHVWLQARQVWMYSRLYNEVDRFKNQDLIDAAKNGMEFLRRNAIDPKTRKCYLTLTREGKPMKVQRTIFSECFYTMALSELGKATNNETYIAEAKTMMDTIVHWLRVDDSDLGRVRMSGNEDSCSLAVPMMVLCLLLQFEEVGQKYPASDDLEKWCTDQILMHVQKDGSVVLENVKPSGEEMNGSFGRLMTPGHAIEAGWFLLQLASQKNNDSLQKIAIEKFIMNPFKYGWDSKHGGLFYFLDADGWCPTQLEWDMKLWWPHNETLIAFLAAYKSTGSDKFLQHFQQVFDYSYSHFVDKEHGEWYGYLSRNGEVSLDFKGGPWKGCFHVPRYQYMCEKMLKEILHTKESIS